MPVARRVRRVANPRRKSTARRKLSRKQILAGFGGKRRKAAAKSVRKRTTPRKRNVAKPRATPKRKVVRKTTHRRRSNPSPIVLTLGAVNPPNKKRSTMARRKTRRKTNARRRVHRRRTVRAANPTHRRRRTYRRRRNYTTRRRTYRRRRNPDFLGMRLSGSQMAQAVLGGLVGVAAAKFIPTAIPNIGLGQGNVVRVLMTGVSAFLAGYAAEKAVGKPFGSAVLFGGLMQTGSVALNIFLPSVGAQLGLSGRRRGVGDLVDTRGLVVPYNPVMAPIAAPRIGTDGIQRAFGNAYGW